MLSRLSLRNVPRQLKAVGCPGVQSAAAACNALRTKRPVEAPPVRMGFIPEEWFTFFYSKTGATGPYVFLGSVSTFLLSKEYYILEHEFYNGLSLLSIILYVNYKFGSKIAQYLDKEVDKMEEGLNVSKEESLQYCLNSIKELETEKWRTEGQLMIFDIKKQNVIMQLEADYRERVTKVYSEVKKYLDYHAQIDSIQRSISQKHMVQWITSNVLKAFTPEQEKANLLQCIKDLEGLSARA